MKPYKIFYGWVIVCLAFLTLSVSFGIWYSFSVFLVPVLKEMASDRAGTAGIFSAFMTTHALSAFWIGFLLDRFGPRRVIPFFGILAVVGLAASSKATALWHLYASYGAVTALGICGIGHFAQSIVLPKWFNKKRGLALGLAMAGAGVGTQIIVPFSQYLIAHFGWRSAYLALALLVLSIVVPLNLVFQRRGPNDVGQGPDGDVQGQNGFGGKKCAPEAQGRTLSGTCTLRQALHTRFFWYLFLTRFVSIMGTQAVMIHQVAHVVDQGLSAERGAFFLGLAGIMGSVGKVLFGYLSDRMGRDTAYVIGLGSAALGVVSLLFLQPGWGVLLFPYAILFGVGQGAIVPIFPARAADLFHGAWFGRIYGLIVFAGSVGAALGGWLSGKIFDLTDGYHLFFIMTIIMLIASMVLFRMSRPSAQ